MKNKITAFVFAALLAMPTIAFSEGDSDNSKSFMPNEWEFYGSGGGGCFYAPPWLVNSWESLAKESIKDFDLYYPGVERLKRNFNPIYDGVVIPYEAVLPERVKSLKWGVVHNGEIIKARARSLVGSVSYGINREMPDPASEPSFGSGQVCLELETSPKEASSNDFAFVVRDGVTLEAVPVENVGYDVKFSGEGSDFEIKTTTREVQPVKSFMFKDNLSQRFLFVHWNEFWGCSPISEVFKIEGKEGIPVTSDGGGCD